MIDIAAHTPSKYEIERQKPMPSLNHSIIQTNLLRELSNRYKNIYRAHSELSLDLSGWASVPDISIYPKNALDLHNDVISMTEPPLCVIEITSPSQSLTEMISKTKSYFAHGVKSCWIVMLPTDSIYVFSAPDQYEVFRSNQVLYDSVIDLSIPLNEVFE